MKQQEVSFLLTTSQLQICFLSELDLTFTNSSSDLCDFSMGICFPVISVHFVA